MRRGRIGLVRAAVLLSLVYGAALPAQAQSAAADAQPVWTLAAAVRWEEAAQSYLLRLETSCTASADEGGALLCYTLSDVWDTSEVRVQLWTQERTEEGWSSTIRNCPGASAVLKDGSLRVTGFDASEGQRLIVQLVDLKPDYSATFGGQSIPAGEGGLLTEAHQNEYFVMFPSACADLPLRADYAPVNQTLLAGQAVNFGYMLRPPQGGSGTLPDGGNNAWCDVSYTVFDAAGQTVGVFRVPAGKPVSAGQWDAPLPDIRPAQDVCYTVAMTWTAVRESAGTGRSGTAQLCRSAAAQVRIRQAEQLL